MINELRTSIKKVENGYVVTGTEEGSRLGEYKTFTMVYTDINDAMDLIKKMHDKIHVSFSNQDSKGSL
jgi:hypothetical protein